MRTMLKRYSPLLVDLSSTAQHPSTVYDLIANVIHESVAGTTRDKENTVWKVQLRAGTGSSENEKWFQIQDLIVEEIRKEMIFLGETVIQVLISPSRPSY
jgi:U4/U6.U5 tri-snRNP-associated protein 2